MISIAAATSLGQILESDNQLHQAVEKYESVLHLAGKPSLPATCEAHLGLALSSTNGMIWMPPKNMGNKAYSCTTNGKC